jgi:hypothetical protein
MSVQFVESEWVSVKVKGVEARLQVREPNAMEGVRYFAAVDKHREAMKTDFEALERIIQTHINLLTACVLDSENFEPAFPKSGSEKERASWIGRIPWTDVSTIASTVATVGYPKTSAGSDGETSPG